MGTFMIITVMNLCEDRYRPESEMACLYSKRAAPSVEAHHHVNGPTTGRNCAGRRIKNLNFWHVFKIKLTIVFMPSKENGPTKLISFIVASFKSLVLHAFQSNLFIFYIAFVSLSIIPFESHLQKLLLHLKHNWL